MGHPAMRDDSRTEGSIATATDFADRRGWSVKRVDANNAILRASGVWKTYDLAVSRIPHREAVLIVCAFELRQSRDRTDAVLETMRRHNDRLLFGHFSLSVEAGVVSFRYALPASDEGEGLDSTLDRMLDLAVRECDRFYPALRLSASANLEPSRALASAMMDPVGRA